MLITFFAYADEQKITDEAQHIYDKSKNAVYQIKVINNSTGQKSIIGSGFLFSKDGFVATNYHVVASAVRFPKRYRIEYVRENGSLGRLKIIDVDVIHDLAIAQDTSTADSYLSLGDSSLSKGTRIFAMGNPHDLSTTIVEGTYNGLMENTLYKKILFSGSLNHGMSGGPAFDHNGCVIGINVSTAGNQISFLVPVENLRELYEGIIKRGSLAITDWDTHIEAQLVENQGYQIGELLKLEWKKSSIGETFVPGEISKSYKCWADSKDYEKKLYKSSWLECSCEDMIYLDTDFTTGKINYNYIWMESAKLNPERFYNSYENFFSSKLQDNAGELDVTNFKCSSGFILAGGGDWKASLCSRQYKRFHNLFDVNLNLASVDKSKRGLAIHLGVLGVTKDKAIEFINKFLNHIQWQKQSSK